ncbi:MAG: hypothetical protein K2M15_06485 [Oscillospiraceae bacterium]|nr:hypothetical protein [Oscillospiraceae bacterium]MDE7172495.1 hypothetical protein [Oscillospiraceae bacterium]
MSKKYTFPVPGCGQCPHHQRMGSTLCETRYCAGFKRRKPKRFRKSDPASKAPKWCPRRITPPVCRVHGFKDEQSAYMDLLQRAEYHAGQLETVAPLSSHYVPRTEIPLRMTAKQFFDATQEEPLFRIMPNEVYDGEIIEIDDGLQPYYFYILDYATVIPLPYFCFSSL